MRKSLPEAGQSWENLQDEMAELRKHDVDWRNGRASVYVFHPGDDVLEVAHGAYGAFISENGLGPAAFPSLKQMESDVVDMALSLQSAPEGGAANMTSGGSESILLAIKACRDWHAANRPVPGVPEIILPYSGHPAFDKGAQLMGLKVVRTALTAEFEADVAAVADAISDNTVMIVGSAPCFPYGVTDPIPALSDLALDRGVWLHVDACVGGYVAPFMREIDPLVPPYDFALPGVRSMSADLHKYGYAAKGASTVLYRDASDRDAQVFDFDDWPCGRMVTPTFAGTRPGGAIAAAWAVMHYLGRSGYVERAERIYRARAMLENALDRLDLKVYGSPRLSLIAFGDERLDMLAVGQHLYRAQWFSSRVRNPDGIHLMVSPAHEASMEDYIEVLARAVETVRSSGETAGQRDIGYSG